MVPLTRHDIGARPHLSLPAWPVAMEELEAYHEEIGRIFGLNASSFEEDLLDDLDRQGLFPRADRDFSCRWMKWLPPKRRNLAVLLKREIDRLPNLQIWLGATVLGFGLDRESARLASVQAGDLGGRRLTVSADEFILAAGAIESTRLLLLLDRASDERAFERCSVLGRYFQDHLDADVGRLEPIDKATTSRLFGTHYTGDLRRSLHLELTPEAQRHGMSASAFAHVTGDLLDHRSFKRMSAVLRGPERESEWTWDAIRDLARDGSELVRIGSWRFLRRQLYYPKGVPLRLRVCIEQIPDWANRICLSGETDRLGIPKVRLIWRPGEAEERTFRTSIAALSSYWRRAGFDRICPIRWSEASKDRSRPIADGALDWAHPSGTTRMGTDPATSVVDPNLQCHHVANVSVASASVFPTAGSSNPTMTIAQLALRLADRKLGRAPAKAAAPQHRISFEPAGLAMAHPTDASSHP